MLLTVDGAFDIAGRGVIVVPGPLQAEYEGPRQLTVMLRLPCGSEQSATLTLEHILHSAPPKEPRWACLLRSLTKTDVPVGTKIWVAEADGK